jgi:hypothetical protein
VAYDSIESGRPEVYAVSIEGTRKIQVSSTGATRPRWTRDGSELLYLATDGTVRAVPITVRNGELVPGNAQTLLQSRASISDGRRYDISPDGKRLIVALPPPASVVPVTVLTNWQSLLTDAGSHR